MKIILTENQYKLLNETIHPSEAYDDVDSVRTICDGKRGVAFVADLNDEQLSIINDLIQNNNLRFIDVPSNPFGAYIIFKPEYEKRAKRLRQIANKHNGFLTVDADENDTYEIGKLLEYDDESIKSFIERFYKKEIIKEDPDTVVFYPEGSKVPATCEWDDIDTIPFGEYKGDMIIGYNQKLFESYLRSIGEIDKYLETFDDSYTSPIPNYDSSHVDMIKFYSEQYDYTYKGKKIFRNDLDFPGRLWYYKKVISFWKNPETYDEFVSVLYKLKQKIKDVYEYDIDFSGYVWEFNRKIIKFSKLKEFFNTPLDTKFSGDINKVHIKTPLEKEKLIKKNPDSLSPDEKEIVNKINVAKKSAEDFKGKKEKGWNSLARRNFVLNKDVAENID